MFVLFQMDSAKTSTEKKEETKNGSSSKVKMKYFVVIKCYVSWLTIIYFVQM